MSVTDYSYNAWNQMVSAGNVTYTYNAQGLRVSKTSSGETNNFTLVGGNVWSDSESKYLRGIELIANDTQIYLYNIRGNIYTKVNTISIDKATHRKISGFYGRNIKDSNLTVRQWLSTKDYEYQYQYGLKVLEEFGVIIR